ncbi:unnamed protein product [Periconia digitata]|uniref:Uncharacterized protein n=1 Tax=Periconia digitata TaxID=1303443 RepID=A0A9W4UCV6_9PLEO|nr:unnamed protein product [Periconia digitata]
MVLVSKAGVFGCLHGMATLQRSHLSVVVGQAGILRCLDGEDSLIVVVDFHGSFVLVMESVEGSSDYVSECSPQNSAM